MRIYALERSLSREERLADVQSGVERSGRSRRREGRPPRRLPRGGERRRRRRAARLARHRRRDGHRQDGARRDVPLGAAAERAPRPRRVHARADGGARTPRSPSSCARRSGRRARSRSRRSRRSSRSAGRRRGRGRRRDEPDGRAPGRARDQPPGRAAATRTRTRAGRASSPACATCSPRSRWRSRWCSSSRGCTGATRRASRSSSEIVHSNDPLPIFVLLVTRPDDRVLPRARGRDAHRAARARARGAGAPRRDAPRRARRRAPGLRRPAAEGRAATRSSCSR